MNHVYMYTQQQILDTQVIKIGQYASPFNLLTWT